MAKDRSLKEYAAWIIGGMMALSFCANTAENMSASGTGKLATAGAATAAGGAAGYGCSKVGFKTCLGGGGGGGKDSGRKPTDDTTPATTPATTPPTAPPDTSPPDTAPPVTLIPHPNTPAPTPGTTPGGIILPPGVDLDRTGMDAGPATPDLRPCAIGGVGQIGMGQC